ncbi:MAG: LicD family protein [Clostridia bacterium]|nr:LicD family protein [Clostridia bacterium]
MEYKIGKYDLKDVQNVMLEMMADIHRVCKKHGINYILDGGSMLGAVRHKGFIPWDDDLDIAMLRDDYIRFTEIANKELDKKYVFQCNENTKEYPYNFGKVFCVNTQYVERFTKDLDICHGVYIDVFPMDYVDENDIGKLQRTRKLIGKLTEARYGRLGLKSGIKGIIAKMIPIRLINHLCLKKMMYHYKKSDKVQKLCHFGKNKPPVSTDLFTETVELAFEKYNFCVPAGYDAFLRGRYGNYMELPPLEDQKPAHHIISVEL